MEYTTTETDAQPLLSGDSPSCNDSCPGADYYLVLDVQPPAQVQANTAISIVASFTCHQLPIAAFATLLCHTGEKSDRLRGTTTEIGEIVSHTTTKYYFDLEITTPGKYRFGISLARAEPYGNEPSWLYVETEDITVTNNSFLEERPLVHSTKMEASHDETLDLQPLLPCDSPRCNTDDFPEPSSTVVVPCLVLEKEPPAQVQINKATPIVALLTWDTTQHQPLKIDASTTLLSCTGEEPLRELPLGNIIDYGQLVSPILTKFPFTLDIPDLDLDPGLYRFRISFQIGLCENRLHVESKNFTFTNSEDIFEDNYDEDLTEEAPKLVPLHCREMGDSEYAELEYAEHLPWKMSLLCKVVVGGITYDKRIVFIPEVEILRVETDLYDKPKPSHEGFFDYGEGLYIKDRVWYEIDEEENEILDSNDDSLVAEEDEILEGDDWQKYRKGVECFQDNYVGVQRVAVTIVGVPHIAHLVLYEVECYWGEQLTG